MGEEVGGKKVVEGFFDGGGALDCCFGGNADGGAFVRHGDGALPAGNRGCGEGLVAQFAADGGECLASGPVSGVDEFLKAGEVGGFVSVKVGGNNNGGALELLGQLLLYENAHGLVGGFPWQVEFLAAVVHAAVSVDGYFAVDAELVEFVDGQVGDESAVDEAVVAAFEGGHEYGYGAAGGECFGEWTAGEGDAFAGDQVGSDGPEVDGEGGKGCAGVVWGVEDHAVECGYDGLGCVEGAGKKQPEVAEPDGYGGTVAYALLFEVDVGALLVVAY